MMYYLCYEQYLVFSERTEIPFHMKIEHKYKKKLLLAKPPEQYKEQFGKII